MRRIFSLTALWLSIITWLPGSTQAGPSTNHPLRLVIVGDSTVCNYPASNIKRGWGMYIQNYFKPDLKVINLARSGRSTKTFIQEGLWARTLKEKPDYVLIQFGHNDSHAPGRPESTDANTTYKAYLRQYIAEARAVGAKPVLVTPMCRRNFDADGKLKDALLPYADAMRKVAEKNAVPLVDLHTESARLFERLGPAGSNQFADKPSDHTHFNEQGAKAMAALVMQQLPLVEPSLKPYLKQTGNRKTLIRPESSR